jgi:hypothetical protein
MSKSSKVSAAERQLRASIAGLTGWANTKDRSARGRHMQAGIWEKCLREVNPDILDEKTRHASALSAYKAHYRRMALKSAQARRERLEAQQREAAELKTARANGVGVA